MSLLQILELDTKISLLCATSGTFSKSAKEALLFLLQNCSNSIYIFLGFDNDKQGKVFTKQLEELLQPFSFTYEIKIPQHKDFDEDLQTSENAILKSLKTYINYKNHYGAVFPF